MECGSNMLSGVDHSKVLDCVNSTVSEPNSWEAPEEYMVKNTSSIVIKSILGL